MLMAAVLWDHRNTVVHGIQLGFSARASSNRIGSVFAHRQPYSPAVLTPLKVRRAFWVSLLLTVDDDQIRLNSAIRRQDNRTVPQALAGSDSFGEVDFLALRVRHGRHLRFN